LSAGRPGRGAGGKDLTGDVRQIFYEALEGIAVNLREISREGLPRN